MPTPNNVPAGFVQINLIRPDGTSETVRVSEGATLDVLLQQQGFNSSDVTARVDRAPASGNQQLQNGQTVSVSPNKVAGAAL